MIEFKKEQVYNYIHYNYVYNGYNIRVVIDQFAELGYRIGDECNLFKTLTTLYSKHKPFNTYNRITNDLLSNEQLMLKYLAEEIIDAFNIAKQELND